jgi:segregation and condensation protein B
MQGTQTRLGMTNPSLPVLIESILFNEGGVLSIAQLAKATESSTVEVTSALSELADALAQRGIRVVHERDKVGLATAPESSEVLQRMRKEELEGPVGKAGMETLAIIAYRGPLTRADIEYIRGVNVSTMLRTLMIRGLIERVENPNDKRSFQYRATADLPAYLGVTSLRDLPEFASVTAELESVIAAGKVKEEEVSQDPFE